MGPEAIKWLNQFSHLSLDDRQRLALVYLRYRERIDNRDYRRLNRVDPLVAGAELRGLVNVSLAEQHGIGRGTYYTLDESLAGEEPAVVGGAEQTDEERILAYVAELGSINNPECRGHLGVEFGRASYLLKKMAREGLLRREGQRRWTVYRLP